MVQKKISNIVPVPKKGGKPQSAEQKKFARLTQKIEKLKSEIKEIPAKEQLIRQVYTQKIESGLKEYSSHMKRNIKEMDRWFEQGKLTARRKNALATNVIQICNQLLSFNLESEEDIDMLTNYCYKYREKQTGLTAEEQKQEEIDQLSFAMKEFFGFEIDEELTKTRNSQDFFQKLQEKMNEQNLDEDTARKSKASSTQTAKKATKKELEKQLREQQEMKSLRKIYIELVSELHPDKESDEVIKLKKEEQLKNITEAYRNKDIFALLTMQLNWIEESEQGVENQPNAILKQYNNLLDKQLNELQEQLAEQSNRPLWGLPMAYSSLLGQSVQQIRRLLKGFEDDKDFMLSEAQELEDVMKQKKQLNMYLDEADEANEEEAALEEFLMSLFEEDQPQKKQRRR